MGTIPVARRQSNWCARNFALYYPPVILYKEIPSFDGERCDAACFVASTSRLTNLDFKGGIGELAFTDPGDDPIARLKPLKILTALYGTLDDLYPETIRVLDEPTNGFTTSDHAGR